MTSLRDLLTRSADAAVFRKMIGFSAEWLMEVGALAGSGKKSA